jgi:hypothetical protein
MTVRSFEINSIEVRRYSRLDEKLQNVKIDQNSTVTLIVPKNEEEVEVDFRFTIVYGNGGIGNMRIEGKLLFQCKAQEIARQWNSTHNMPDGMASEIHTFVMGNCITEAVVLARDVRLPPPIPLPRVEVGKQGQGQPKPGSSPEIA